MFGIHGNEVLGFLTNRKSLLDKTLGTLADRPSKALVCPMDLASEKKKVNHLLCRILVYNILTQHGGMLSFDCLHGVGQGDVVIF